MTQLRDYQQRLKYDILTAWQTYRSVLAVSPTASGKTVLFSDIISDYQGASVAIAHRQELVSQMSLALARCGVRHGVIAPKKVAKNIVSIHMRKLGRSYYDPTSRVRVAGIDTLIKMPPDDAWLQQVGLAIQDEGHHALRLNKWGKGLALVPNAKLLLVTATPCRADGKGLGTNAAGVADVMVEGPSPQELLDRGYLTPFRIFAPPTADLNLQNVTTSAGGDFSPDPLREAVHASRSIVGDVVKHYLKHAAGMLGVTFAVDVEAAAELAAEYRRCGVTAEIVTADTPDHLRISILERFERREVMQLVNVDLFGEGFDLPAIEVVSFARPTQSFALFVQQFGRALRLMLPEALAAVWDTFTDAERRAHIAASSKPFAIILDHVGNVERHRGAPVAHREWTLDGNKAQLQTGVIPVRTCVKCTQVFERFYKRCPYCGFYTEPPARTAPEFVDGELGELTQEALDAMAREIRAIDYTVTATDGRSGAIRAAQIERQRAQQELRYALSVWGGWRVHHGESIGLAQRRFFHTFGVDVGTAQTLGAREATELRDKVCRSWQQ